MAMVIGRVSLQEGAEIARTYFCKCNRCKLRFHLSGKDRDLHLGASIPCPQGCNGKAV